MVLCEYCFCFFKLFGYTFSSWAIKFLFILDLSHFVLYLALLNFDTPNKISMHKQQKRVLDHLQILRIAVGLSSKSRKIVTQKSVHALDGVRVCFSSEMLGWVDEIVGMPIIRRIKFCVNMANFIC